MLKTNSLFYKYYDTLFARKDYREEAGALIDYVKSNTGLDKVLEIGCGTGNHTLLLSGLDFRLTAIDIDVDMISMAKEKLSREGIDYVDFELTPVEELQDFGFSAIFALFNVVTYISSTEALKSFFKAVSSRLSTGGLFVFDCWNGTAVLQDLPGDKLWENISVGDLLLDCHLTSKTEAEMKKTLLTYEISTRDKEDNVVESGVHQFEQFLWTIEDIEENLIDAGLSILRKCPPFEFERDCGSNQWKMMFCCTNK